MRRAGGASWRIAADAPEGPHVLLFVRDALRLPVDGRSPGRLDPAPPDLSADLSEPTRRAAADYWHDWWHAAVEDRAHHHELPVDVSGPPDEPTRAAIHEWLRQRGALTHPPFSGLAQQPELQRAAQFAFERFPRWWCPPPPRSRLADHRPGSAAEGFGIPGVKGRMIELLHRDRDAITDTVRGLRRELHRPVRPFDFTIDVLATTGTEQIIHTDRYALLPAGLLTDRPGYRAWLHQALRPVA